jgi:hypothetical protein
MVEDLKDWNYKIIHKEIIIKRPANLEIADIENSIQLSNTLLLKWAIVKIENNNFVITAIYLAVKE